MVYFFSLIFILKLDEPFRNDDIFIISLFSNVQIWVLRVKIFFCSFWSIFYLLDPEPYIFADPDAGSQNLADPTDPEPKHCINSHYSATKLLMIISMLSNRNEKMFNV